MLSESLLIAFDCPPSADDWTLLNKSSMFKFTTGSTKELKAGTELDDFLVEKISSVKHWTSYKDFSESSCSFSCSFVACGKLFLILLLLLGAAGEASVIKNYVVEGAFDFLSRSIQNRRDVHRSLWVEMKNGRMLLKFAVM